jgi:hypothetical protein
MRFIEGKLFQDKRKILNIYDRVQVDFIAQNLDGI